jgi:hypothetical protein
MSTQPIDHARVGDAVKLSVAVSGARDGELVSFTVTCTTSGQQIDEVRAPVAGGSAVADWPVSVGGEELPCDLRFTARFRGQSVDAGALHVEPAAAIGLVAWDAPPDLSARSAAHAFVPASPTAPAPAPTFLRGKEVAVDDTVELAVDVGDDRGQPLSGDYQLEVAFENGDGKVFVPIDHKDAVFTADFSSSKARTARVSWKATTYGENGEQLMRARVRFKRRPGDTRDLKDPADKLSPVIRVGDLKARGKDHSKDVFPPRYLYSLNRSPGALQSWPTARADPDDVTAVTNIVNWVAGRLNAAGFGDVTTDGAFRYQQPGLNDTLTEAEKWARRVAEKMSGMPYVQPDLVYGSQWELRFRNTGAYPLCVLCQMNAGLALLLGGWDDPRHFSVDGTEGTATDLKSRAGAQWITTSNDLSALVPGGVFVWATPDAVFSTGGVQRSNVGHDSIVLRKPTSSGGYTINGDSPDGFIQAFDTGVITNRNQPDVCAFPKGGGEGGVWEETFVDAVAGTLPMGDYDLVSLADPKARIRVSCTAQYQGCGPVRMHAAGGVGDLHAASGLDTRPRGIARLVIRARDRFGNRKTGANDPMFASSWFILSSLSPLTHLMYTIRGAPGSEAWDVRWQVHAEGDAAQGSVGLVDILTVNAGNPASPDGSEGMVDNKRTYDGTLRGFDKAKLGPDQAGSVSLALAQTLDGTLIKDAERAGAMNRLSLSPAFSTFVLQGTIPSWDPANQIVPIIDLGLQPQFSQLLVWKAATAGSSDRSPVKIYDCAPGGEVSLPFRSVVSTYNDGWEFIQNDRQLFFFGVHGQTFPPSGHVFDWRPTSGSTSKFRVWKYQPVTSGKKDGDPLPGNPINKKGDEDDWNNIGSNFRMLYLPTNVFGTRDRVLVWDTTTGDFWVWEYDISSADPLPNPPKQSGTWTIDKRPKNLIYLDKDQILEWAPDTSYKVWTYDRRGPDPIPLVTAAGQIVRVGNPTNIQAAYLGKSRLMVWNPSNGRFAIHHFIFR